MQMERIHEPPKRGLDRQFGDFEDACEDRVTGDEAQLIQPWKADIKPNTIPNTNPYKSMARGIRSDVTVCSTSGWKPSLSSMVITGNSPP